MAPKSTYWANEGKAPADLLAEVNVAWSTRRSWPGAYVGLGKSEERPAEKVVRQETG